MTYQRAIFNKNYAEVKVGNEWMEEGRALSSIGSDSFAALDASDLPEGAERIETVEFADEEAGE